MFKVAIIVILALTFFGCGDEKRPPAPRPSPIPTAEPLPSVDPVPTPTVAPVPTPAVERPTPYATPVIDVESYIPPIASVALILFVSVLMMGLVVRRLPVKLRVEIERQ